MLAFFGMISLDHAHAAQRFGQTSRDLSIDLAPFTENRPYGSKGFCQRNSNHEQSGKRQQGHNPADGEQKTERDRRGKQAARELNQPGPQQVANTLHVAHDARDQGPSFVGVIKRNRKPSNMFLHFSAQIGDQALCSLRQQLRQRKRRDSLNRGCNHYHEH